jgi:hypothetical protein
MDNSSNSEESTYCDTVRRQIEHEDSLVVNRLSWLMGSQAFLFTAYAIVVNGPVIPRSAVFTTKQDHLLSIIPLLGVGCCALIYAGVLAASVAMRRLRADLAVRINESPTQNPPIQGTPMTRALGMAAPWFIPPMFCLAWIYLL